MFIRRLERGGKQSYAETVYHSCVDSLNVARFYGVDTSYIHKTIQYRSKIKMSGTESISALYRLCTELLTYDCSLFVSI